MICKNCSAEYSDDFKFCPKCGTANENKISLDDTNGSFFVLDISEEDVDIENEIPEVKYVIYDDDDYVASEKEEIASEEDTTAAKEEVVAEPKEAEVVAQKPEIIQGKSAASQEEYVAPVYNEEQRLKDAEKESEEIIKRRERIVKENKKAFIRRKKGKIKKESNKATILIAVMLCAVGLITAVLTVLKMKTDAFEQETQPQKAVALSGLSAEEEMILEKELSLYYSAIKMNFSKDNYDIEKFISSMNPGDKGNIYSVLNSVNEPLQTTADPVGRFADEYGEYSYYKVEKSKVDKVLERFDISCDGEVNSKECYYYDGFYYFDNKLVLETPSVGADISKSKKVLDGSYYVECYFYVTDGSNTVKSDTYYIVATKNANAVSDGYSFKITEINSEPIFNAAGNPTNVSGASGYKTVEKVIEGRTTDGTLYSRYVIEYPVFEGTAAGEESINEFFSGTVTAYELKAASAQQDYESFISQGGKAEELPFTESITTRVTYADDEKISLKEVITSYSPEIPEKQEVADDEDGDYYDDYGYEYYSYEEDDEYGQQTDEVEEVKEAKLHERRVEAYTFDRVTGDFIEKDSFIGKNYMVISEILYRIYNSYEYESIIPEEVVTEAVTETTTELDEGFGDEDYYDYDDYYGYDEDEEEDDGIPDDEYGFGTVIYESPCCFTADGFTFFYVEDEGYVTEITIPFEVVEKLENSKSVTIE